MSSLYLSDILKMVGLDPNKTKLVRHNINNPEFKYYMERGHFEDYQRLQTKKVFDKADYILSFLSSEGTSARFYGCYEVKGVRKADYSKLPILFPDDELDDCNYYILEKTTLMNDMEGRLIIDWGKGTLSWTQWAYNDKKYWQFKQS